MKNIIKIISTYLSFILIICAFSPSYAASENEDLSIKEKLIQKYLCGDDSIDKYEELYFHKNLKNEFDWALIYATTYSATDEMIYRKLGDIVIEQDHGNIPFEVGYAIYDYEDDKFYDIIEVWNSDKYKDLREVFANVYFNKDLSIKEKLIQTYLCGDDSIDKYEELYFHKNLKNEFDWALIYATTYSATDEMIYRKLGDIVIEQDHGNIPFEVGYAIYDYEDDKFYDIIEVWDSDKFNGLQASFQNYYYSKLPLGDANLDGNLSIIDATCIQKNLVGITQFNHYQNVISDVNKSGDIDICDATLIQRYLAGMITDFGLI